VAKAKGQGAVERPTAEQLEAARQHLEGAGAEPSLTVARWVGVATALGDAGAVAALGRLASLRRDKAVLKEVRRQEHRLRSRGVAVAERARSGIDVSGGPAVLTRCAASWAALDGPLAVVVSHIQEAQAYAVIAEFGEQTHLAVNPMTARQARGFYEGLVAAEADPSLAMALPNPYALWLLGRAVRDTQELHVEFDPLLAEVLLLLGRLPEAWDGVAALAADGVVASRSLNTGGDVWDEVHLLGALPSPRWGQSLGARTALISTSPLIVGPEAHMQRYRDAVDDTLREMVSTCGRAVVVGALRHNAILAARSASPSVASDFLAAAAALEDGVEPTSIGLLVRAFEVLLAQLPATSSEAIRKIDADGSDVDSGPRWRLM